MTAESESTEADDEEAYDDHLGDVDDGAGCAEIWERLSESRDED